MFSRVTYESWHTIVPLIAFATTALVFGVMTLRGVLLRKEHAEHLSKLPLED